MMRCADCTMSAVSLRITGDFPPSSGVSGTRLAAAARATLRPDGGAAGEDQVIESEVRERDADVRSAGEDGQFGLIKRFSNEALHQGGCRGSEFGRFDHRAIARSKNADDRGKGELEGEIPDLASGASISPVLSAS